MTINRHKWNIRVSLNKYNYILWRLTMAIAMETEEQEEEEMMIELGNLSNYVVESIFSKIPLKSLVQLKTVSKKWRNSITNIRHCYPLTTSTGFVLFLKHKTYQESIFMKLHD